MIRPHAILAVFALAVLGVCACSSSSSTGASGVSTLKPLAIPAGNLPVRLDITQVKVSTGATPVLLIGMQITNGLKQMQLCDPSFFSIELADGTRLPADQAADNVCTPDSLDPKATGSATMYFDLASAYTGKLTVIMESSSGAVVGATTTVLH